MVDGVINGPSRRSFEAPSKPPSRWWRHAKYQRAGGITLVIITLLVTASLLFFPNAEASIVPQVILKNAPFSVYYTDPAKLPVGFQLDQKSFTGSSQTVVFVVHDAKNQRYVFTNQARPSDDDLQTFYSLHLPLSTKIQVPLGTATIGAITTEQTIVSLPTKGSWLLMTGPPSFDQKQLQQLLTSLTLAR